MTDLVNAIKQTPGFLKQYDQALAKNKLLSLEKKAQVCDVLTGKVIAWEQAGEAMAAEIVDLTEENDTLKLQNDGLKVQLGDRFNKEELQNYCKEKKVEFRTDESRSKRILTRLNQRLAESQKCIDDSMNSAAVVVSPKSTSNRK